MMRFGTFFTLSVAVAAGIGLFHAKYRVQALESELSRLQQQIQRDREAIHVLRAEWSFLNDPDRLAELSRRHLELAPVAGAQLATLAQVPEKLPLLLPETPPGNEDGAPQHDDAPAEDSAPLVASAPAPAAPAVPAVKPATVPATASAPAPSPFEALPEDVQAVLASMRSSAQ
jgi:hypothetical protein